MAKRSVKKQRINDRINMDDDRAANATDFVYKATDLTDFEAQRAMRVIREIQLKFIGRSNSSANLEEMRDEILTKLSEVGVLATVDPTPCFYGDPPLVDIIGKVGGVQEMDHEKKRWEVNEAIDRGEDFRGQKERYKG